MQERILHSVDLDAINSASLMQRAATFGILYDKERLERGQSTANVAYDSASIRDRYQELKAMLAEAVDNQGIEQSNQVVDIASNGNEGQ